MTSLHPDHLVIIIKSAEPIELRLWLIQSLAASIRWHASSKNKKENDYEHLENISSLIDALAAPGD